MQKGEIKTLYKEPDKITPIFPVTTVKAVSDTSGKTLDKILEDKYATKNFVSMEIARAQIGGGDGDVDLDGYATEDYVDGAIEKIDFPVDSVNGQTGAIQLTASDVGAAPAGYGLGVSSVGTTFISTITQLNDVRDNRWFIFTGGTADPITVSNYSIQYAGGRVDTYNGNNAVMTLYPYKPDILRNCGSELRRTCNEGTWGEWEWDNPPMIPGVEYRTTKRHNGKPVYRKIVSHTNSVTWAGNNTYPVAHGVSNLDVNNVEIVLKTAGYCMPYLGADGTTAVAFFDATHITVRTTGSVSWGSRNWYFEMKYTKSV